MKIKPNWRRRIALSLLALAVISGIGYGINYLLTNDSNPIPKELRSEIKFSPLVIPKNSDSLKTSDYKFDKAENIEQTLSYIIHIDNNTVTLSEYVQPPQFTEIPEYKDRFLSNVFEQQSSVQSASGVIYLGRTKQKEQIGVMIEKGLLVFLNPEKNLSDDQWRAIGDQLEIQKL